MTEDPDRPTPRLIELTELFADPQFAGASISPDGQRIAYLAPAHGRRNVWVRGVEEDHDAAVCVTHDARRGISSFSWTDDPRWLLYLQDTDGNEDWHLHRVDLDDPETPAVDLTPMDPGSRVFGIEPSRAVPGTVLAWMNRRPMFIDIFRIDVASGDITVYHELDDPRHHLILDRSDRPAFAVALTEDGSYEFSAVDPGTDEQRLLRRLGGAEYPVGLQPQLVTPDGRALLLGAYPDPGSEPGHDPATDHLRLVRIDRQTGAETVVAERAGQSLDIMGGMAPAMPPSVFTSQRTGEVIAARFVGDRPHIEVLDPYFAEVYAELSKLSDGVLGTLSSDEAEQRWVASFIHDRDPGVAWFYDHATGESRRLFRPYPWLDPAELAPMTPVTFPARDGLPLPAFLTLPVGVEPTGLPLVLVVHGGPWAYDSWGYDPTVQLLANRGYAVLQVNFRGSTGYGARHTTSAIGEFAAAMQDDLIDAASWAVDQGWVDPARIGIHGGSYGGYAALVGVTSTPDFFAAAVDYVGVSDLANFLRTLPPFTRPHNLNNWYRYVGDPEDPIQEADMLSRSPITKVDQITTPLLVAQGANDVRVVQAESDNIVASLRERGVPVEYLLATDEGHGFANPENVIRLHAAMERHFAEHLGGRLSPATPAADDPDPTTRTR